MRSPCGQVGQTARQSRPSRRIGEEKLAGPLPKLAAGECNVKRVAKCLNTKGFVQKLQAVIGSVPHDRIATGDHDQREPKRFSVFGQRSARLASHRGVDNDWSISSFSSR